MITIKRTLTVERESIGSFFTELTDVLDPSGSFTVVVKDCRNYPEITINVPENYGIQFETFMEKWFGLDMATL